MIVRRNYLGVRQEFQTSIIEYTSDNPSDNEQTFTSNPDLKYPYIYNNQTWNIDLETSSSLLESRTAIFVTSFKGPHRPQTDGIRQRDANFQYYICRPNS
jgi:hypothetical protein